MFRIIEDLEVNGTTVTATGVDFGGFPKRITYLTGTCTNAAELCNILHNSRLFKDHQQLMNYHQGLHPEVIDFIMQPDFLHKANQYKLNNLDLTKMQRAKQALLNLING